MAMVTREMLEGNYERRLAASPIRELHALGEMINRLVEQVEIQVNEFVGQAFYDSLTQLPNRSLFVDRLGHALARARRTRGGVAVMFLDIDNFKLINDTLGHHNGDALLVGASERLREAIRVGDTVARLGGDEFTVLLEDITDAEQAIEIADRILERVREPFTINDREVFTTVSIGIALSAPGQDQVDDLLRNADAAMYQAKSGGKARYMVFDRKMSDRAAERLALETDLRHALEQNEFRVFYQPIVRLHDESIYEVEALIRWEHPEHGLIPPGRFIPIAEETGLIVPIGLWVLRESCRQVQAWREQFPDEQIGLSVNLSGRQFQHPELVEDVSRVLAETRLDPTALELEVTESVMMQDIDAAVEMLQQLKRLGLRVAVDDFGTGYSSLAQLRRLPVDVLKVDRSFIERLTESSEDEAIVRSVISLAESLNLDTIGEGIETFEQLGVLRSLHCRHGQGYYFARPVPGDAMEAVLNAGRAGRVLAAAGAEHRAA